MSISEQDMARVAELARIRLDDATVADVTRAHHGTSCNGGPDAGRGHRHVEPMANPLDAIQRLRADEVTEPNHRERFQAIAPAVENGLYLVPRVIE